MKIRTIGLTLAFCFLAGAACLGADPQMGTWKLNESKSKITPGTLKNTQVVYSSMFGRVKIKADGINANGKSSHTEWSGKFDGKDYPVTGDPNSDARSYTKVNERTLTTTNKKNGKVTVTGQIACLTRWQNPHSHVNWDHSEREKIQERRRLRQAVSR
jgi:hypothetical protein